MKYTFFSLLAVLLFFGWGCFSNSSVSENQSTPDSQIDRSAILEEARENGLIMDEEEMMRMAQSVPFIDRNMREAFDIQSYLDDDMREWDAAALADVTEGESYGLAHRRYENGIFTVVVMMGNLPVLAEGEFFEGWLVRRGEDFSFLSVGRAQAIDDGHASLYLSATDLSSFGFFVLTLQSEDGDGTPAQHILEGTFK